MDRFHELRRFPLQTAAVKMIDYAKDPRRKTRPHRVQPRLQRLHPRRRQGRRHGLRPIGPWRETNAVDNKSPFHSIQDYRANIRAIVEQRFVDIMLMSVSTSDALAFGERLFETSPVTPAIRANDTTDIWLFGTQAAYGKHPSVPFRTAIIDEAIGANANGLIAPGQPQVNLGLYSITLNNDVAPTTPRSAPIARSAKRRGERASATSWKSSHPTRP